MHRYWWSRSWNQKQQNGSGSATFVSCALSAESLALNTPTVSLSPLCSFVFSRSLPWMVIDCASPHRKRVLSLSLRSMADLEQTWMTVQKYYPDRNDGWIYMDNMGPAGHDDAPTSLKRRCIILQCLLSSTVHAFPSDPLATRVGEWSEAHVIVAPGKKKSDFSK